jgi:uncharacterized protein YkwD
MRRVVRIMLVCVALGGCASSGSLSSLSNIGGPSEPEKAKDAASKEPAPVSTASSSSGGGIWSNFSSVFSSGAQPVSQKSDNTAAPAIDPSEALRLINEYRAQKHLSPLSLDPQATAAATVLVKDMAKHDRMSHIGPDGQDVGKRLINAGYSYRIAAENVGVGQASLQETIESWKKSPPHSRNMLLPGAKHIGIAYEYKGDTKYKTFWTLVITAPDAAVAAR